MRKAILAVLLLAVAVPAPASQGDDGLPKSVPDEKSIDDLLKDYDDNLRNGRYSEALKAVEQLNPDVSNREGVAFVSALKATALFGLKRDTEAREMLYAMERLAPQNPDPFKSLFIGGLMADRVDVAGETLDKMIARFPDQVREIEANAMRFFLRGQREKKDPRADDRLIALGQLGYGGAQGDYLTADAVKLLLKRGDHQDAIELLRFIDNPQLVENLLIQKRYSALWPALEALAGPNLATVRHASVVAAQQELGTSPDAEKVKVLANTLRLAGRLKDTVALQSKLPSSRADWKTTSEDIGWVANEIALAWHAGGNGDEADRTFATLNGASIDNSHWLVNMKINRLELLVADGKFDRAQALIPLTEESATKDGSPYAQQLVRKLKYCTLHGLGRTTEAAWLLPKVVSHAKDARGPTIDGLLCAGELGKAEEIALAGLEDEDFQEDFVRALQVRPLTADDPSIWHNGWVKLRTRPAIANAFDRLGRDIPERFLPVTPSLTN